MDHGRPFIRFGWGRAGLAYLAEDSDVFVIVDVLSFSTCVEIAVSRAATVYPFAEHGAAAAVYAQTLGALLVDFKPLEHGFSFSPASLQALPHNAKIVLPSPNGSTLSLATGATHTLTGCLRNAAAVAQAAQSLGRRIAVIGAGEKWPDGSLRPALEDLLGAGAIIDRLEGERSGDAHAAAAAFADAQPELYERIRDCPSGQELIEMGRHGDVKLACELDKSVCVPQLIGGAYHRRLPPK